MFYNPGWTGGPITLAGTDARYKPQGQHIMLDVYESDAEYLNDMDEMTRVCKKLLLDAGMHILSVICLRASCHSIHNSQSLFVSAFDSIATSLGEPAGFVELIGHN